MALLPALAGCGGSGANLHGGLPSLKLQINGLLWVPQRARLYASVSGFEGANGNSIAVIDPVAHKVLQFIPVGSEPRAMAASDDGTTLYVGLDGAGAVRRVDLTTNTANLQWSLGRSGFGSSYRAQDLDVMPGTTDTVAVACNDPMVSVDTELRIYDNGVARPQVSGFGEWSGHCRFNADGDRLYSYDSFTSGATLYRYTVDANGLALDSQAAGFGPPFAYAMLYFEGRLYFSSGPVYDAETGALLGTYPAAEAGYTALSGTLRRVYAFDSAYGVQDYRMDDFVLLGRAPNPRAQPRGFAAMDQFGVAYGSENGFVYFVSGLP